MTPDTILSLIKWIGAGIAALAILTVSIINLIVSKKKKGETVTANNVIEAIASPVSNIIQEFLPLYMAEAETVNVPGAIRKVLVLAKVALKCSEVGIDYQSNSGTFSDAIENLITLTKKVNSK